MYDANTIELLYANGTRGALSNICHGNGADRYASVIDLKDAVEDSETASELVKNISALVLVAFNSATIDRDTANYTRIKGTDSLGNVRYLKIGKQY